METAIGVIAYPLTLSLTLSPTHNTINVFTRRYAYAHLRCARRRLQSISVRLPLPRSDLLPSSTWLDVVRPPKTTLLLQSPLLVLFSRLRQTVGAVDPRYGCRRTRLRCGSRFREDRGGYRLVCTIIVIICIITFYACRGTRS